jgi:hypothetical protein
VELELTKPKVEVELERTAPRVEPSDGSLNSVSHFGKSLKKVPEYDTQTDHSRF